MQNAQSLAVMLALILNAGKIQEELPQATDCFVWDQRYLTFFHVALGIAFIGTILLAVLVPPLLGRRYWPLTRPYLRILMFTGFAFLATSILVLAWPHVAVDPQYFQCSEVTFGAEGLLGGRIGSNVAAISQRLTMVGLLALSAILGMTISFLLSHLVNRYVVGIPKTASKA